MTTIKTVLFDLDGALANTAPDLANALNQVLKNHNKPALPIEKIRSIVSNGGGAALISLGFHIPHDDLDFEPLKNEFLGIYRENIVAETILFSGISELLSELEAQKINWCIVTNKPGWLTEPLLEASNLTEKVCSLVCGDTLYVKIPNPKPLLHACQQAGSVANECIYVGDAERDILAGSRANMRTAIALYGYIDKSDDPQSWGADKMLHTPLDLLPWINNINKVVSLQAAN